MRESVAARVGNNTAVSMPCWSISASQAAASSAGLMAWNRGCSVILPNRNISQGWSAEGNRPPARRSQGLARYLSTSLSRSTRWPSASITGRSWAMGASLRAARSPRPPPGARGGAGALRACGVPILPHAARACSARAVLCVRDSGPGARSRSRAGMTRSVYCAGNRLCAAPRAHSAAGRGPRPAPRRTHFLTHRASCWLASRRRWPPETGAMG